MTAANSARQYALRFILNPSKALQPDSDLSRNFPRVPSCPEPDRASYDGGKAAFINSVLEQAHEDGGTAKSRVRQESLILSLTIA